MLFTVFEGSIYTKAFDFTIIINWGRTRSALYCVPYFVLSSSTVVDNHQAKKKDSSSLCACSFTVTPHEWRSPPAYAPTCQDTPLANPNSRSAKKNCHLCGSNAGPCDLQSHALPTELRQQLKHLAKCWKQADTGREMSNIGLSIFFRLCRRRVLFWD